MEQLIPITGYAKSYEELCNKVAMPGEYYNVIDGSPFMTYHKLDAAEIGDTLETTDVLGWYQVKAELESNVNPNEGDVYIVGISAPYTRLKAQYVDYVMSWVEDGKEEKKIVKKYKNQAMLTRARLQPEEGIFYSVGSEAPYKVYGVVSQWEPVGVFISFVADKPEALNNIPVKNNPGEIAYVKGLYYLYTGEKKQGNDGWTPIDIPEPIENIYKHVYKNKDERYKIREGVKLGTLELFSPRE